MTRDLRPRATNRNCTVCGTRDEHGELNIRPETLAGDGEWVSAGEPESYPLCGPDWEWVVDLARIVTGGTAAGLGVPAREPASTGGPQGCDYCLARLGESGVALDIVPARRTMVLGDDGPMHIWNYRLCRQCAAWWRTTLFDSSAVRSQGQREHEGASGGWLSTTSMDVVAIATGSRDTETLRTVAAAEGRRFVRLPANELGRLLESPNAAIFAGANATGRASKICRALPGSLRERCIVVGRGDATADVRDALLAGAADVLAWPLSPQQIAGAIDRLNDPPRTGGRDAATGLPILAAPFEIHGQRGHLLRIAAPEGSDGLTGALLLRRFLRGYDVVGCDGSGGLAAVVACSAEHVKVVAGRIKLVLGDEARVTIGESNDGNGIAA